KELVLSEAKEGLSVTECLTSITFVAPPNVEIVEDTCGVENERTKNVFDVLETILQAQVLVSPLVNFLGSQTNSDTFGFAAACKRICTRLVWL
ncbi:MAG: hypothetical protein N2559_17165, partial [Anaerolineae bacterium]|nr:hypothetical protein [Anaerolineae bacterium]